MATILTAPISLEEFSKLPRGREQHEVSAGQLITMPPPKSLHNRIARMLFKALEAILDKLGTAEAYVEAGYILSLDPLTIRQPDVSVLSKERIRSTGAEDYFEDAPELAVEIVSPSDSAEDLQIKIDQYLRAGAKQVWVLYPKTKRVYVFYTGGSMRIFEETQTLEAGDLLPGFSVKVADLFLNESHATS